MWVRWWVLTGIPGFPGGPTGPGVPCSPLNPGNPYKNRSNWEPHKKTKNAHSLIIAYISSCRGTVCPPIKAGISFIKPNFWSRSEPLLLSILRNGLRCNWPGLETWFSTVSLCNEPQEQSRNFNIYTAPSAVWTPQVHRHLDSNGTSRECTLTKLPEKKYLYFFF